jgi:general secretion pathway protein H
MRNYRSEKGFTLLELVVVLFIIVLGFSVIGFNISSGNESTQLKAAARDMVSALRYARGQALISRRDMTVTLDLTANTYTISQRDKSYAIPKDIDITVVTAQSELNEGLASVRFFPDGSSTGGRITLEWGHVGWRIDINWLTGQIDLEENA